MKKLIAIVLVVLLFGTLSATAEGLLPQFDDVFGVEVPSMANSLGREPTLDSTNETGERVQVYNDVTEDEYTEFSGYLTGKGCAVSDYSFENGVINVVLSKDGVDFWFDYDVENQQAKVTYPSGVRVETFHPYRLGGIVTFGKYEQDGNTANGPEPIEWIVLEIDYDNILLISRYALDVVPFNSIDQSIIWRDSSLREWLNNTFYASAFSSQEQSAIMLTHVDNSAEQGYPRWLVDGVDTEDKVYLLSYKEANQYFADDASRVCFPTAYTISKNVKVETGEYGTKGASAWWLRSRGYDPNYACKVDTDGGVFCYYATSGTHFTQSFIYSDRPVIRVYSSYFED